MLSIFFTYHPQGDFHYFNTAHILAIVLGIALIIGLCVFLRNLDHKYVKRIMIAIWIIEVTLDIIYWSWEIAVTGKIHPKDSLPLYYCSLFYMVLPFAIWIKNDKVKQGALAYLATFNLIAGLMGLIINTNLNVYPVFSFVGLRSLLYHYLMIFVSLLIWATKYYRPNIHHSYCFIVPLLVMFLPALVIDLTLNTDYFYLNGGFGTPFEILSSNMPKAIYILILYLGIMVVVNLIFYIPTIIRYIKSKKQPTEIN